MAFWLKLMSPRQSVFHMDRRELRKQEILLDRENTRLINQVAKITAAKQQLFEQGKTEKAPEMRRMLAQQFEGKTHEQLSLSRELNIRSKERMTIERLRMIRERNSRSEKWGGKTGFISAVDMTKIQNLMENDSIRTEAYQERLDEILSLGQEIDEGALGVSDAGLTLIDIWDQMDTGLIADDDKAFDEADQRVREHQTKATD